MEILRKRLELGEKVLSDEVKQLQAEDSNLAANWFGETKSETQQRRKIASEVEHLEKALGKVAADRKALDDYCTVTGGERFTVLGVRGKVKEGGTK